MIRRSNLFVAILALAALVIFVGCDPKKTPSDTEPFIEPVEGELTNDEPGTAGPANGDIVFESRLEIYRVSENGANFDRLTSSREMYGSPSITPDGKAIVVECLDGVCVVSPDGEISQLFAETEVGSAVKGVSNPYISPDGEKVVFSAVGDMIGNMELFVYDIPSGSFTRITNDGAFGTAGPNDAYATWTPGGGLLWQRTDDVVTADASVVRKARRAGGVTPTVLAEDGLEPEMSPDGSKIAFSRLQADVMAVWVMNSDGSDQTKLTSSDLGDGAPTWSPDGAKIAFTRKSADTSSGRALNSDLMVMNADGTGIKRVADAGEDDFINDPDWGDLVPMVSILPPDCAEEDPGCAHSIVEGDTGTTIVEFDAELTEESANQVTVNYQIVPITAEVTTDYNPQVANTITFAPGETLKTIQVEVKGDTLDEPDETFRVELLPSTGVELGRDQRLGSIVDDDEAPSPSPSPTVGPTGPGAIAYQTNGQVWVMKPDGSDQHKLTDGAAPDWKHDGSQIAFFDQASADPDIFQIPPTGGTPTQVNGTSSFDGSPSWAPDGSGISWTNLGGPGAPDIYKAEPPTGTPTPVLATAASEFNQDWDVLHDGTEVMAVVKDSAIILVDPDTGAQIGPEIVPAAHLANNPAISPDGTKLAYNSNEHGDPDIFVKDLTNLAAPTAHLTTDSAEDVAPTWSPDGTMLAFQTNRDGNFEIYTMNATTGAAQTNITNTPANEVEPAWGPAGTAAVIRATTDAVDEPSTEKQDPTSVVPSHGEGRSPSSSGTERGVRVAIPGLLLSSWLVGRRRKRAPRG